MKTLVTVAIVLGAWAAIAKEPQATDEPKSALIVIENAYSRQGIATNTAISIVNRQTIKKLGTFFPKYRDIPSSELASGWEHGYTVYFNFQAGKTVRIMVSENGGGDTWTIRGGDLKTNGDFKAFVDSLLGPKPSRASPSR